MERVLPGVVEARRIFQSLEMQIDLRGTSNLVAALHVLNLDNPLTVKDELIKQLGAECSESIRSRVLETIIPLVYFASEFDKEKSQTWLVEHPDAAADTESHSRAQAETTAAIWRSRKNRIETAVSFLKIVSSEMSSLESEYRNRISKFRPELERYFAG